MKALICSSFGQPESLSVGELPEPEPSPDQILIDVHFASLNFPDILMVAGTYQSRPTLPFAPGMEVSGFVRSVGGNVKEFKTGDRVLARTGGFGAFAERALAHRNDVFVVPDTLSLEQAAGFSVSYSSAYHALADCGRLKARETLLVLGAGGGTGLNAVEIGKALGARVLAAAGSAEKLEAASRHGADEVINYRDVPRFREWVKDLTNGNGANVIFDPVGGDAFDESLRCIAFRGRILVFGFASGRIPNCPTNLLLVKGCELIGVFTGAFAKKAPEQSRENIQHLLAWYERGKLKPVIPSVFALEDTPKAMMQLMDRTLSGKAAIRIG